MPLRHRFSLAPHRVPSPPAASTDAAAAAGWRATPCMPARCCRATRESDAAATLLLLPLLLRRTDTRTSHTPPAGPQRSAWHRWQPQQPRRSANLNCIARRGRQRPVRVFPPHWQLGRDVPFAGEKCARLWSAFVPAFTTGPPQLDASSYYRRPGEGTSSSTRSSRGSHHGSNWRSYTYGSHGE